VMRNKKKLVHVILCTLSQCTSLTILVTDLEGVGNKKKRKRDKRKEGGKPMAVDNTTAELEWIGGVVIGLATLVAVSFGGGMKRKLSSWFYRLKLRWFLPFLAIGWIMAAVFTVSAVGFFLFWRRRKDFNTEKYDAVMGLHFGSLLAIYFMGNMLFHWSKLLSTLFFALLAFGGTTAALVLMGIEKAWLQFGLYFVLPVFMLYIVCMALLIWWFNWDTIHITNRKKKKKRVYSSVSSSSDSGSYTHQRASVASIRDEERGVQNW